MATTNTGYKGYSKLLKVTNDGTNRPLDENNMLCSETGLPQSIKDNIISDPDYFAPIQDLVSCPTNTTHPTPVNCVVSEWSAWSECTEGSQTRTRTIITPSSNGGTSCPVLTETQQCEDATVITVLAVNSYVNQCGAGNDSTVLTTSIVLSSPVSVDTMFSIATGYSLSGDCTNTINTDTQITVLAGNSSGESGDCLSGANSIEYYVTICGTYAWSHDNMVDVIML